ncbi:ferredoxin [Primorskyibacter sp. S187A]|uniref:ferredoxin n=1 Tax=Primorskyibacter sp. S187A TaxID=3415130 RepID=UPI003C7D46E2
MVAFREEIETACAAHALTTLGVMQDDGRSHVLVGTGAAFWPLFTASLEYQDGASDALDRWSQRIMPMIAEQTGAQGVVYPFGGPPYAPFIRWAFESGETFPSPVGMLVHARAGFWISFRGALVFDREIDAAALASPCPTCAAPCTTACPVGALAPDQDYDVPRCKAHVASDAGRDCREGGCLVRRVCPVGQRFGRDPEQTAFHMRAFMGAS